MSYLGFKLLKKLLFSKWYFLQTHFDIKQIYCRNFFCLLSKKSLSNNKKIVQTIFKQNVDRFIERLIVQTTPLLPSTLVKTEERNLR
jgi:hypothetical protein